ncbi:LysR family transcriptional regulator [Aeromonas bivalvium]|uniref:LysR family transcriptional regulator n=1 Tax=Aeromonas bivalvium TaxID=440079 RepID=UPI000DD0487E|nr:LysR family transcriptional regulator [Aeromonas bivalvium]
MNGENNSHKSLSLPSLTALRCFEVAARTEHFGRAADELHLTHGAISRAVRLLEEDLGVRLFERRQRRVFLTEAGERLYRAVREGLGGIRQTAQALRQQSRPQSLVLSCEPTLLMRWLIPRWPAFQALHPELDVHLMAGGGALSFDSGIDLAIRRNDFHWPEDLHSQLLFEERTGPVCQPGKVAQFFERREEGWALRPSAPRLHTKTRPSAWQAWQQHAGLPADAKAPGQRFEHFYFSLQGAVAGLGVAIGPYRQVCDDIEAGLLAAPLGFVPDGSGYHLLAPAKPEPGSPHETLANWLHHLS